MIDEKKLLADLEKEIQFAKKCNMPQMVAGMNQIKSIIERQPKVVEWIPCSERLPNREEYLRNNGRFILDDGNRRYQGLFDISDGKFKFSMHIYGLKYELLEDNCVVAWMSLPEPYKEKIMNKTNVIQCESCTEPTKSMVFMDGLNCNSIGWMCDNIDCPHIDTAEKQKSKKQKQQETREINRKNGIDVRKLAKLRIRAQLNLVESAEIVRVSTAQYSAWEREREPIPVDKYNALMEKYKQEISNHRCSTCYFFNGEPGDGEQFCDRIEDYVHESCKCIFWTRRDAH